MPLNIFIVLAGVVVWTEKDEIEITGDSGAVLRQFNNYRREHLLIDHPNDNAQLLVRKYFNDGVVGNCYYFELIIPYIICYSSEQRW